MDIISQIQSIKIDKLNDYINSRIVNLEENTSFDNTYIGFDLNTNPTMYISENNAIYIKCNCIVNDFIPLYTKIIYGMQMKNSKVYCGGSYYYLDTDSYIYDFIKFIYDKTVYDEYDLFDYILEFLNIYFGTDSKINREKMNTLIYRNEYEFFELCKEHGLSDFINKGNALCTENSIVVHNILTFLNFKCNLVIGAGNDSSHSYNIISYIENETGIEKNLLLDFSAPVANLNIDYRMIYQSPFIYELHEDIESVIDKIQNGEKIICEDYFYMFMYNSVIKYHNSKMRTYSNEIKKKNDKILKK